jgi:hypothetical protein
VNKSTTIKNALLALLGFILLSTPLAASAQAHQYGFLIYELEGQGPCPFGLCPDLRTATIIGYRDPDGDGRAVTIPPNIGGYPVTKISDAAFAAWTSLTSIAIPGSVTSIGNWAFYNCTSLTSVTMGNGVTSIGVEVFYNCISLTSIIIPGSLTSIGEGAFSDCTNLTGVFFKGNAPGYPSYLFDGADKAVVYYLLGTIGWRAEFGGAPTALWNPLMQTSGVGPSGFGFNITGPADIPILVEGCTNLANASWVGLQSLRLTNGAVYFRDPEWTNYPARIYRIRTL